MAEKYQCIDLASDSLEAQASEEGGFYIDVEADNRYWGKQAAGVHLSEADAQRLARQLAPAAFAVVDALEDYHRPGRSLDKPALWKALAAYREVSDG